ncbi:thrombospondin type 3 repeat-containing protein [Wenyingzhuangia sp. IMCC45574]
MRKITILCFLLLGVTMSYSNNINSTFLTVSKDVVYDLGGDCSYEDSTDYNLNSVGDSTGNIDLGGVTTSVKITIKSYKDSSDGGTLILRKDGGEVARLDMDEVSEQDNSEHTVTVVDNSGFDAIEIVSDLNKEFKILGIEAEDVDCDDDDDLETCDDAEEWDDDIEYEVGDYVVYDGKLYRALKDKKDRNPEDHEGNYWEEIDDCDDDDDDLETCDDAEEWDDDIEYEVGDYVVYDGKLYRALKDKKDRNPEDHEGNYWEEIDDCDDDDDDLETCDDAEEWDDDIEYEVGDYVVYDGKLYRALNDKKDRNPEDHEGNYWEEIDDCDDDDDDLETCDDAEEWDDDVEYEVGDYVVYDGKLYRALKDKKDRNPEDHEGNYWEEIDDCDDDDDDLETCDDAEEWDDDVEYEVGDYVVYDGKLYRALKDKKDRNPEDHEGNYWEEIDDCDDDDDDLETCDDAEEWDDDVEYEVGDYVVYDGKLYRALKDKKDRNPEDHEGNYWEEIDDCDDDDDDLETCDDAEEWDDDVEYEVGDYVVYDGKLYRALKDKKDRNPEDHEGNYWEEIDDCDDDDDDLETCDDAEEWDDDVEYEVGDYVVYDGKLYRALKDKKDRNPEDHEGNYWEEIDDCDDDGPVVCNDKAYLFQENDIYTVELGSGNSVLVKENIVNEDINAVGFNVKDGGLWGTIGSKKIVRVTQDYQVSTYTIGGLPVNGSYVGDIDADGVYHIKNGSKIYKIDLDPSSDDYLDYVGSVNLSEDVDVHDWAFNVNDGNLYTVTKEENHLYKINPSNGDVVDLGLVPILDGFNGAFGAVYFDASGNFYVSFNNNGKIYRIKDVHQVTNGGGMESLLFATGPSSSKNDGARCLNASAPVVENDADNDGVADEFDTELTCDSSPVWEYGVAYESGDYVVFLDVLYKAVASSTNKEPIESLDKWVSVGSCQDEIPEDDDTDLNDNIDITSNESCIAQYEGVNGESNHAMWLSSYKGGRAKFYFENNAGQLTRYSDGTATLRGVLINVNDVDDKWSIEYNLKDAKNWNAWKALGRSYKNERRKAGDNYQDWAYYILDASTSRLVGLGSNDGQVKSVRHKPSSYYYGFQIGLAANSKNANNGVSGWFEYQNENNQWVQGDINLDLASCEIFDDTDGDKIPDDEDNCVNTPNADQADADNDDIGDACDDDADNDGVTDDVDNCINTPNADQADADNDDIGDACDDDADNDGVTDDVDNCVNTPNADQADADNDDIGDACDDDADNDGVTDDVDNCINTPNADQADADNDDIGDACDDDADNDGVTDDVDNCVNTPNADQADADNDDIGDACDDDADNDGVTDDVDNCVNTPNADQADADNDDIGDACDADADNDGITDDVDNCVNTPNADQADADNDDIGDACDDDADNDGVTDDVDNCVNTPNADQADADNDDIGDACDDDADNDGVTDDVDNCVNTPNADQADADNDDIGDACDADADNDGVTDDVDNCINTPNADQADADNDDIGDACDDDADNDGVTDDVDNCVNTPNADQADADNDDIGDACDDDADNDGITDDVDNCVNTPNADQADADNDDIGDACDDDADNDGVTDDVDNCINTPNADQADNDNDDQGDVCDNDDDNDGVTDDVDNCQLVANPDQEDRNDNGIGDACELVSDEDCFDIDCSGRYSFTFEKYLVQNGYDDKVDGVIVPSPSLAAIKTLDVSGKNMVDLKGIEHLTGLEVLIAKNNELSVVDLTKNVNLKHINLGYNNLIGLNVRDNILLEELYLGGNELESLELYNNLLLKVLELRYNKFKTLDVRNNKNLEYVGVKENGSLESLLLGTNPSLKQLFAGYNVLDSVDLSGVLNLVELYLNDNNLTGTIDLDLHHKLKYINLCNNQLDNYPPGSCVVERVLPEQFDTLEEYMVFYGLDLDDVANGVINPRADVFTTTSLDLSLRGIKDMSGIELFASLTELQMSGNSVTEIDLSNNTLLRVLNVSGNRLDNLNLSNQIVLEELYAANNCIRSIDLSSNLLLTQLVLKGNKLSALDLTANEGLVLIEVQGNVLEILDLGYKMALTHLYAGSNKLTTVDVGAALNLIVLSLENNLLQGTLDLDKNTCLLLLNLSNNLLSRVEFKNDYNARVPNDGFNIVSNPNLTCVKVDEVVFSVLNWTLFVEDSGVFTSSEDCSKPVGLIVEEQLVVVGGEIEVPADVVEMKIFTQSGRVVANMNLLGLYYVKLVDVNGEVSVDKIVVID